MTNLTQENLDKSHENLAKLIKRLDQLTATAQSAANEACEDGEHDLSAILRQMEGHITQAQGSLTIAYGLGRSIDHSGISARSGEK